MVPHWSADPSGSRYIDRSRSHENLVAAIDRRIIDGRNTHYRSPAPSALSSNTNAGAHAKDSPLQSGKAFFALCRERLDQGTYSNFLSDIKGLKVNKISREEVMRNANGLFAPDNLDLVDKLKQLLFDTGEHSNYS